MTEHNIPEILLLQEKVKGSRIVQVQTKTQVIPECTGSPEWLFVYYLYLTVKMSYPFFLSLYKMV